ncbi:MAG TPA: class I SAM-dependent methyltransferase [Phenylobacterium sp.]|nr:class I SAM-dependent methyltransferase [Phenylobacterium sp.]
MAATTLNTRSILYGTPAPGLVDAPADAVQVSPLIPGSTDIATLPDGALEEAAILAPPGTLERDFVLAHALRALKPGGQLIVFAPKDKGGSRLKKVLERFGCAVAEDARRHHRFCYVTRPQTLTGIADAIAAGAPRLVSALGLWSQPGVFSWDRLDPGSALLLETLPALSGRGADLGAGIGVLGHKLLSVPAVTHLAMVEIDRRAVEAAKRNVDDPRVEVIWADVRRLDDTLSGLDFVVMNPPFHDGGAEDRGLGIAFIVQAAKALRKGGVCWLTANRHLPYEGPLGEAFAKVTLKAERGGYKIYEARK